jgi:hypothetical protein
MDIHKCAGCYKELTDVVRYYYIFDRGDVLPYCNVCLYTWCNDCGGTDCKYRCVDCDAACDEECKCNFSDEDDEDECSVCGEDEEECECDDSL